jgi:DNA-binding NarL/FixJ family response regulator
MPHGAVVADDADGILRFMVVDDHAHFRRGVCDVLNDESDMQVVAEAGDGAEAMRLARQLRPTGLDLILMDVDMPGVDGIEATRRILAEDAELPVIMLTVSTMERDLIGAVEAGAKGFLSKGLSPHSMLRTLRDFQLRGALPMPRAMAARVFAHYLNRAGRPGQPLEIGEQPLCLLTRREQEVLELLASGARDRDIAERLVLSEYTVEKHVQHILRKLDARNRTEAVFRHRASGCCPSGNLFAVGDPG